MANIYRSYEVLVEETAGNHKTRRENKTAKALKPHHENTARALRVTHDLFQDAVCYYILCLIGLIKDATDKDGKPVNRMWDYLIGDEMRSKTTAVATRLTAQYFRQTRLEEDPVVGFLKLVFAKAAFESRSPAMQLADDSTALHSLYCQLAGEAIQLKKQGKGKHAKQKAALKDMARFASDWLQRLSNPQSSQAGKRIEARNNRYWLRVVAMLRPFTEPKLKMEFDDVAFATRLNLKFCFNSPTTESPPEDALIDYGKAFAVTDPENDDAIWDEPPKTAVRALAGYAVPRDSKVAPVKFETEVTELRRIGTDDKQRANFSYPAASSGAKPSGTYWALLRYKFAPSAHTRSHLFENIRKRKESAADDPLEEIRKEYGHTFPFFTNLLGLDARADEGAVWTTFDKSAFKRAAEEVFKYRIRSDEREDQIRKRQGKINAMVGDGKWIDEKGRPHELGGLKGDDARRRLMKELLDDLGGAIGYGLRRATVGGWADLRQDFLKVARQGEPIDEDKLEEAITKARDASGGGFGSGAFFKKLCERKFHGLWLPQKNPESHHSANFVRWWVLYSEATDELAKILNPKSGKPKPISFTWPEPGIGGSFRPLDFDCSVSPSPKIDLFDQEAKGKPYRLIKTNVAKLKDAKGETIELVDAAGQFLYPLTLSYRRLKRDRIANADGGSVTAEYAPPLVVGNAPSFQASGNKKDIQPAASLLPPGADGDGCFHFMFSFQLDRDMQKKLHVGIVELPPQSMRMVIKSGKLLGLNFRWPVDAITEKRTAQHDTVTGEEGVEETNVKFSPGKLWCATDFAPFDILSVDLGVRFAGAWSRAKIFKGQPGPNQRTISAATDEKTTGTVVFHSYDRGTFRLQGEDAKIWRKDKNRGFGSEPEQEKCGSRGRVASQQERDECRTLAQAVLPATPRFPLPEDAEVKFFPELGDHLVARLRRRLGRIKFLFRLRWQAIGKIDKFGHEYRQPKDDDEWREMRRKQRFKAIESLAFVPREDEADQTEEDFMRELRLALAPAGVWESLQYEHSSIRYSLFAKVKGGEKEDREQRQAAQSDALRSLKQELEQETTQRWNWAKLAKEAKSHLDAAMGAFASDDSLISNVAQFAWPLRDKKWKWHRCKSEGEQSRLERDETSSGPPRFIHGMRGLSIKRIRLMQDFRQCCQSLAKLERRYYLERDTGLEPSLVERGDEVHEPANAFLSKINELRDQRVFQTAHMILAEALGLELMNPADVLIDGKAKGELKSERDLHGRYKQRLDKDGKPLPRVAAIVLEDLVRYRTSQDRSRFENSQLMEWSHRSIIAKLQDMAQVFGIQIVTVDARFSSRFSSRTSVPGIRCAEVAKGFETEQPWKRWAEEKVKKGEPTERANMIIQAAESLNKCTGNTFTLVLPIDGGPAFLPMVSHGANKEGLEDNADINAAVNIGLRAVAHPDRIDIFPVLRTEAKAEGRLEIKNRRGSLNEKISGSAGKRTVELVEPPSRGEKEGAATTGDDASGDEELESGKFPYLYAAVPVGTQLSVLLAHEVRYQLPVMADGTSVEGDCSKGVSAAKGKDYWTRVKAGCWKRAKRINAARLSKHGIEPPKEWET